MSALKYKVILVILFLSWNSKAQNQLDFGINAQKSYGFIWENGITMAYSSPNILKKRIQVGAYFLSSSLGSAYSSNAVRQEQAVLFGRYFFVKRLDKTPILQPFGQLNIGYIKAHFIQKYFEDVPSQSALLSLQLGVQGTINERYNLLGSVAYNSISGNGVKGLGSIYPLFFQFSFTYAFNLVPMFNKNDENDAAE